MRYSKCQHKKWYVYVQTLQKCDSPIYKKIGGPWPSWRDQIISNVRLKFWHWPFSLTSDLSNYSNYLDLFLQSKPTQAIIFELKPDLKPDLSEISARPQLDLNWIELSLTLLLLLSRQRAREASAFIKNNKRRRLWEPLEPVIVRHFQIGAPFFWSDFRKGFFLKNGAKWSLKLRQKCHKIWQKTNLKRSPQKMLKMCKISYPRTCKKRVFAWKGCQKSLKPEVWTNTKTYQKNVSK